MAGLKKLPYSWVLVAHVSVEESNRAVTVADQDLSHIFVDASKGRFECLLIEGRPEIGGGHFHTVAQQIARFFNVPMVRY